MNKNILYLYFFVSIFIVVPGTYFYFDFDCGSLIFLCAFDILFFIIFCFIYAFIKKLNILAPTLWAMGGYILFGQFPIVMNYLTNIYRIEGYSLSTLSKMFLLILIGYRALLFGILIRLPQNMPTQYCSLPNIGLIYPFILITIGTLARIFIRNNLVGSVIESWAWYYSFFFLATPVGLALLYSIIGQRDRAKFTLPKMVIIAILLIVASLSAIVDVSRKDTGMILFTIIIVMFFKVFPQHLILRLNFTRWISLSVLMLIFGLILMGTRAYSWSRANNTDMASELEITFKERRAHDCTIILAFVLDTTPSLYPYLYGKTIGSLVPLPRSVFPNRPPAHSYVVGLQRQGINLTDFDSTLYNANPLSLSAHLLGEGYANFGILGALLFEFMFGFLVCYYEVKLNKGHLVALRLLYPVLMFFILTQQRGDIAMMNTAWMLSVCFAVGILLIGSSSYRKTLFLKLRRKNYVSQTENR